MKFIANLGQGMRKLLLRRFETAELLIAVSLFLHGVWLLFPNWSIGGHPSALSRGVELFGAVAMILAGGSHIPLVLLDWRGKLPFETRRWMSMASFLGHIYLLALVVMTVESTSVFIIPYTILTLLGALAYLSMSVIDDG